MPEYTPQSPELYCYLKGELFNFRYPVSPTYSIFPEGDTYQKQPSPQPLDVRPPPKPRLSDFNRGYHRGFSAAQDLLIKVKLDQTTAPNPRLVELEEENHRLRRLMKEALSCLSGGLS